MLFDGQADLRTALIREVAASMADAVTEALVLRGVPARLAGLAAQTGWATFHHAAQAWIDDPSRSLADHLQQAFNDLRALSAAGQ